MTAEARAALARCTELGCSPALVADAAAGAIDPLDLVRWVTAWAAAREADRSRGGWMTAGPGGTVIGTADPPQAEVIWIGSVGKVARRVQRAGVVAATDAAELWCRPRAAGWTRVPAK